MDKQYLDKDGLEVVKEKVNEARETAAGAIGLAQQTIDNAGSTRYSTTEQDTGNTWINGKKIYRKCYTGTASVVSTNTLQIIDNDFTTTNGYKLLWAFGSVGHAEGQILTLPYQDNTVLATIQQVSDGLAFYHKNPVYAFTFEVMVEYTKNN